MKVCKILVLSLCILLTACAPAPPHHQNNICHVFHVQPHWYWAALATQHRWGIPVSVLMAVLHRESHFRASAVTPRRHLLGFIPWFRQSSAYGYAQVTDETWHLYETKTQQHFKSRSNFKDAIDFVGWYLYRAHYELGIAVTDAYHLYLAYHEGIQGYREHSYRYNTHLLYNARHVQYVAWRYHAQLLACRYQLPQKSWWHFW